MRDPSIRAIAIRAKNIRIATGNAPKFCLKCHGLAAYQAENATYKCLDCGEVFSSEIYRTKHSGVLLANELEDLVEKEIVEMYKGKKPVAIIYEQEKQETPFDPFLDFAQMLVSKVIKFIKKLFTF